MRARTCSPDLLAGQAAESRTPRLDIPLRYNRAKKVWHQLSRVWEAPLKKGRLEYIPVLEVSRRSAALLKRSWKRPDDRCQNHWISRGHTFLHCQNEKLVTVRREAWEDKDPAV
jgi:hypothetical protein